MLTKIAFLMESLVTLTKKVFLRKTQLMLTKIAFHTESSEEVKQWQDIK